MPPPSFAPFAMHKNTSEVAVKVCGVTVLDDARVCAAAGVQLIGLNFSPASVRCVSLTKAVEITSAVRKQFPLIKFVGVFLDQELGLVQNHARELALDAVQLHGDETPEYVQALEAQFIIKALRIGDDAPSVTFAEYDCEALLLDTWNAELPGGTGRIFPWSVAAALRPRVPRLILAGGLTSENVTAAIRQVRPYAVDVCSGVEATPGRKDEAKVRRFVAAVRGAAAPAESGR